MSLSQQGEARRGAVVVDLEKKELVSETFFPNGEQLDVENSMFTWGSWGDGETMNSNEKVNEKNLFRMEKKFSLEHREFPGLCKSTSKGSYSGHNWKSSPGFQEWGQYG